MRETKKIERTQQARSKQKTHAEHKRAHWSPKGKQASRLAGVLQSLCKRFCFHCFLVNRSVMFFGGALNVRDVSPDSGWF